MPLGGDLIDPGVDAAEALDAARPLLCASVPKALYDVKALGERMTQIGGDAFDTMLAAYVLDPQRPSFDPQALCAEAGVPWDAACPAASLWPLRLWQEERLAADELTAVYRDIERPLADVLYAMEREGFLIDADVLEALGRDFRARAAELEGQIYDLAGETFNIRSPKQLSEVLFDKLGLPRPRKTNRGFATTSAEVLEALAEDHPICALILEYRKYQKLDSTYVGALIKLRDENGRVHSSFDQTATATGRISSNEPNLQNIPCARRSAARSAPPSLPAPAGCWWTPTIRRSSCGCWRTCPATRRCALPSSRGRISTAAPPPRSTACRLTR